MEDKRLIDIFKEISSIPRCSGNETQISNFIVDYADKLGLRTLQDKHRNVIVFKDGVKGCSKDKTIILQSHLDMVCVKEPESIHDFNIDPISIIEKDGWLYGNGTTLGADNGIGIAMMLRIMEERYIKHPPLELCFTVDEERGLEGAANINLDKLNGKILLNLDGEEEGVFFVSCAGGIRAMLNYNPIFKDIDMKDKKTLEIKITGCNGGHSGLEIHNQYANPIQLLARILKEIDCKHDIHLNSICGGDKENSIPTWAKSSISISKDQWHKIEGEIKKIEECLKSEYLNELEMKISADFVEKNKKVLLEQNKKDLVDLILLLPNGASKYNLNTGDVSLSSNIGVLNFSEEEIEIILLLRSNEDSTKAALLSNIRILADKFNFNLNTRGDYPAWEYKDKSALREEMDKLYIKKFNTKPRFESIHAGLECAYFTKKRPDLDMISLGCNIENAHTTRERMEIRSAERLYDFLVEFLKYQSWSD